MLSANFWIRHKKKKKKKKNIRQKYVTTAPYCDKLLFKITFQSNS